MSDRNNRSDQPDPTAVPKAVVSRLSLYLRELQRLVREGKQTTSSHELGRLLGFTDAQVRKDLAYFGHFGQPGVGYRCDELVGAIRGILGTDEGWNVAIVGMGNLGRALIGYRGFDRQGFRIVAAFDVDQAKTGTVIDGIRVYSMDELRKIVRQHRVRLGMIAVPSSAAQSAAQQLVDAGIEGIVNFAPVTIVLPESVSLVGVDLAIELEQISYSVVNRINSR